MSKRRSGNEFVWLKPNSGFVGNSHKLQAEIIPGDYDPQPCMLECGDKECQEWSTLLTTVCPCCGEQHELFHVSECQMLDEPWTS